MDPTTSTYFVRSRGRTTGPFDFAALQQLARRGKVSRFDHLSPDQVDWKPAGELPGLFVVPRRGPIVPGAGDLDEDADPRETIALSDDGDTRPKSRAARVAGGIAPADAPLKGVTQSVLAVQFASTVTYLVAGGLILLFGILPVTVIDGQPIWWWDGGGWTIAASLYALAAAIALMIVALVTRNLARPVVALSLVALPILVAMLRSFFDATERGGSGVLGVFAGCGVVLMPLLLTCLNRLRQRLYKGGPPSARAIHIVAGALAVICGMAGVTLLVIAYSNESVPPRGPMLVAYLLTWLGVLANVAAGVVAIVAGKPRFSPSLCGASTTTLIVAIGLFSVGAAFILSDIRLRALVGSNGAAIAYTLLRSIVLLVASVAWFSASLRELLTWVYRRDAWDVR